MPRAARRQGRRKPSSHGAKVLPGTTFSGASFGGFDATSYFDTTGLTGPTLAANTLLECLFAITGPVNAYATASVFSNYDTTGNAAGFTVFILGGYVYAGSNAHTASIGILRKGPNCLALSVEADTHTWASLNGAAAVDLGVITYVANNSNCLCRIGSTPTFGRSDSIEVFALRLRSRAASPTGTQAELVSRSSVVLASNVLTTTAPVSRYAFPADADATITFDLNAARDTSLVSLGSSPVTFTKHGNAKVIPWTEKKLPASSLQTVYCDTTTPVVLGDGRVRTMSLARMLTNVPKRTFDFCVAMRSDDYIAGTDGTSKPGFAIDGVASPLTPVPVNVPNDDVQRWCWFSTEAPNDTPAAHALEITAATQSLSAPSAVGMIDIDGVILPPGVSFQHPNVAKTLIVMGGGEFGGIDSNVPCAYTGVVGCLRQVFPGRVEYIGRCFDTLYSYSLATGGASALAAQILALASGNTTFVFALSPYDASVGGAWVTGGLSTFLISVVDLLVASGKISKIYVAENGVTSISQTSTNAQVDAVATARPSSVTLIPKTTLWAGVTEGAGGPWPSAGTVIVEAQNIEALLAVTPVPASISPAGGPTAGGTPVRISGHGFMGATGGTINSVALTSFVVVSDTLITAVSGASSASAGASVAITGAAGTGTGTLTGAWDYDGAPNISTVSPLSGPGAGGTVLTITDAGTGFADFVSMTIGGVAVTPLTVSSTTITCVAPGGAGAVPISVTTLGGTGTKANAYGYAGISSISPPFCLAGGGAPVTITGAGFTGATSAAVNAVNITSFTVVNDFTITGVTAASTMVANVNTTVAAVGGTMTLAASFTYLPASVTFIHIPEFGSTLVDSGTKIGQVNDQSGNNYNCSEATDAFRPAYVAAGLNGHPTARLSGQQALIGAANWTSVFSSTAHDVFIAVAGFTQCAGNLVDSGDYLFSDSSNSTIIGTFNTSGTQPLFGAYMYNGGNNRTPGIPISLNTPYLFRSRHASGTIYASVNMGTEQSVAATLGAGSTTIRVGSETLNRSVFGDYAAIVAGQAFTSGEAAVISTFLQTRYALY